MLNYSQYTKDPLKNHKFVTDENHPYLGKNYYLRVNETSETGILINHEL